jgi:RimJ/RimL family protein N-acetyltransferase
LETQRLILRPLVAEDALSTTPYLTWLQAQHPATQLTRHGRFPYTIEEAQRYITETHTMMQKHQGIVLAIIAKTSMEHIGNIALTQLDWVHRSGEYAIVLGSTAHQGQGYAYEASAALLTHGFEKLGLHRIACGTPITHEAMCRLALKLGFQEEGRRKEAFWVNPTTGFVDVVVDGKCQTLHGVV